MAQEILTLYNLTHLCTNFVLVFDETNKRTKPYIEACCLKMFYGNKLWNKLSKMYSIMLRNVIVDKCPDGRWSGWNIGLMLNGMISRSCGCYSTLKVSRSLSLLTKRILRPAPCSSLKSIRLSKYEEIFVKIWKWNYISNAKYLPL